MESLFVYYMDSTEMKWKEGKDIHFPSSIIKLGLAMRFALVCCPNPLCNCSTPTSLFCKIKVASTRSQCYKIRASFFEFENASFQRSQSDHLMFIRSQVSVETISVKQMIKTSQHRFVLLLFTPPPSFFVLPTSSLPQPRVHHHLFNPWFQSRQELALIFCCDYGWLLSSYNDIERGSTRFNLFNPNLTSLHMTCLIWMRIEFDLT